MAAENKDEWTSLRDRDRKVAFYVGNLKDAAISPALRQMIEKYSGVDTDEVRGHIMRVRDKAWDIRPGPYIGQFRFLEMSIAYSKQYEEVLQLIRNGQKLLDIGCGFGVNMRRMICDGAPPLNIYGLEVDRSLVEFGYELFLDMPTLPPAHFLIGEMLDQSQTCVLLPLQGHMNIIHAPCLLQNYSYANQVAIVTRFVALLKHQPGSMVFGRQMGNDVAGGLKTRGNNGEDSEIFRHNAESFRKLWEDVGEMTGTQWDVDVDLLDYRAETGDPRGPDERSRWLDPGFSNLRFVVRML